MCKGAGRKRDHATDEGEKEEIEDSGDEWSESKGTVGYTKNLYIIQRVLGKRCKHVLFLEETEDCLINTQEWGHFPQTGP